MNSRIQRLIEPAMRKICLFHYKFSWADLSRLVWCFNSPAIPKKQIATSQRLPKNYYTRGSLCQEGNDSLLSSLSQPRPGRGRPYLRRFRLPEQGGGYLKSNRTSEPSDSSTVTTQSRQRAVGSHDSEYVCRRRHRTRVTVGWGMSLSLRLVRALAGHGPQTEPDSDSE